MAEMTMGGLATREGLVERLFAAFAVQVREIEARVARGSAEIVEDAKILSGLAKTLDTLLSLDRRVCGKAEDAPVDPDRLRGELADRLARLLPMAKRNTPNGTAE